MALEGVRWKPRAVARLLWDNGWRDANNTMKMVATIGAESDYYDKAYNNLNPDGTVDYGLFQLNDGAAASLGLTHDEFKAMAFDPYKAAKVARKMFNDRQFQPWAAYANDRYKSYIPTACVGMANFLAVLNGVAPVI